MSTAPDPWRWHDPADAETGECTCDGCLDAAMTPREKVAAYWQGWYAAHREERAAYQREYRETHREELAARDRTYYATNKKEISARRRKHACVGCGRPCMGTRCRACYEGRSA